MYRLRAVAALFVFFLLTGTSSAADMQPLRVAIVSRTVFYLPLWIAQKRNYLPASTQVEVYDNAERINEDLRAGRVQIAISTPESVILDATRGGALRIIAGNAERLPHFIIARPHITSLAGLRGARFGVLSLQEGTTFLVHRLAAAAGLQPGDYQVLPVGGAPTRWQMLRQGTIDAGLQPFPLSYEAEAAGFTNLGPIAEYVPDYLFTTINADANWAGRNERDAASFITALRRGTRDMFQDPAAAAEVAAAELATTTELAGRAIADTARLGILSRDLSISPRALEASVGMLESVGALPPNSGVRADRVVDTRFLQLSNQQKL